MARDGINSGKGFFTGLASILPAGRMDRVLCLETVDSTNKRLREMAESGAPDGQVVLADGQTAGRGRQGRSFASPPGRGIYMSMLLRPSAGPAECASLTAGAAVAVSEAVEALCGVRPGIKWVNDLVLGGKKICGILTEASVDGESGRLRYIIIGVGVNVNGDAFPEEIRHIAASLSAQCGRSFDRARLAADMILRLDELRADWPGEKTRYLASYRAGSVTLGREVRLISGGAERTGTARAINDDFSLAVDFEDGSSESVSSGEVSVRGLYDYI